MTEMWGPIERLAERIYHTFGPLRPSGRPENELVGEQRLREAERRQHTLAEKIRDVDDEIRAILSERR